MPGGWCGIVYGVKKVSSSQKGQAAVETLMAVIVILGLLFVVSLISVQQQQRSDTLEEQEENARLCQHIANAIEVASNFEGQSNITIYLQKPVTIMGNLIDIIEEGESSGEGYYCYYTGIVKDAQSSSQSFGIGEYTLSKNTANEVMIASGPCIPRTCESIFIAQGEACGTYTDNCGGEVFCAELDHLEYCPDCDNMNCDGEGEWVVCPLDCATYGNGVCEPGEHPGNCSVDCEVCYPSGAGNGICEPGEDRTNCEPDCGCGNGICEQEFEDATSCEIDCHCGDGDIQSEYNEVCDCGLEEECTPTELDGTTCESLGLSGGELACTPNCVAFDTSDCTTCVDECSPIGSWRCRSESFGGLHNNSLEDNLIRAGFLEDPPDVGIGDDDEVTSGDLYYQICGYYDADSCLEWSIISMCPRGQVCNASARICVPDGFGGLSSRT
ncbi:hypothetical protein KKE06_03930 [Candidatus Micrarchaeota archaeon]|nr:hypothetical protein [Candidatus Micrarchaeota archaeon]MBU1930809.1 hypothetical protein [Candidatus Micrarchaeota archaeon]